MTRTARDEGESQPWILKMKDKPPTLAQEKLNLLALVLLVLLFAALFTEIAGTIIH